MKELLAVISLLVSGALAEPPAPYPASGWRPNGPAFELPQPGQVQQQPSQYLPPVDPRNPANIPNVEYGTPEEDVSVQGLPPQREEVPFFQRSPVNGQQNVGPAFSSDIRNLDQNLQQIQYQQQQANYREFLRQRQLDAQINANKLPRPESPAVFASRTTSTTTEPSTTPEATTVPSTTEISLNDGETLESPKKERVSVEVTAQKIQEYPGELFLSSLAQLQLQPQFVPLQFGQLKSPLYLQPAQSQKQVAGFDAQTHFAALPSIIAQQKLQQQNAEQGVQTPALLIAEQPQAVPQLQPVTAYQQPQFLTEQVAAQPQTFYGQPNAEPVAQYQPVNYQPQLQVESQEQPQPQFQLQPLPQYAAQPVAVQPQMSVQPVQFQPQLAQRQPQPAQFQPQPAQFQPQPAQFQPQPAQFQPQSGQFQPQPAQFQPQPAQFQPQPAQFQPQPAQFQPQPAQFLPQPAQFQPQPGQFQPQPNNQDAENIDQTSYQPQLYQSPFLAPQPGQPQPGFIQAQLINYPGQDLSQFQGQFPLQQSPFQQQSQFQQQNQFQPQSQGPDALQSGLDVNQQGNDIEEPQDQTEEGQDDGNTATAVATAFGTRTQPRVYTQYGAPFPVPKVQASDAATTTESPTEEVTDDGPVVAHAVAIADGTRKKSAKLRRSRVRPIFTLDRSGHLVLAQQ